VRYHGFLFIIYKFYILIFVKQAYIVRANNQFYKYGADPTTDSLDAFLVLISLKVQHLCARSPCDDFSL